MAPFIARFLSSTLLPFFSSWVPQTLNLKALNVLLSKPNSPKEGAIAINLVAEWIHFTPFGII